MHVSDNPHLRSQVHLLRTVINRARLVWRLMRDPRVPGYLKALPVAILIYLALPVDLLPDIAPLLGQVDDLGVLIVGIESFIALCPSEVVEEHLRQIEGRARPSQTTSETIEGEWRLKE
jgi:uncharacterized membrane protein YkvA (DUF1232 family)